MKWAPIFFLYKDCLAPSFNVVDVLQGKTFEQLISAGTRTVLFTYKDITSLPKRILTQVLFIL